MGQQNGLSKLLQRKKGRNSSLMGTAKTNLPKKKLKQVTIKKYGLFIEVKVNINNNVGGDNLQGMTNSNSQEEGAKNETNPKQNSPF